MSQDPPVPRLTTRLVQSLRDRFFGDTAVAEELPASLQAHAAMIRLAKGGWSSVSAESMGSTVRVTALF